MKSVDAWLEEYGESHHDHTNKIVHWICVPAIMFSIVGLIGSIPPPSFAPNLSWAVVTVAMAILYYFALSPALAVGMILVSILMLGTLHHLANAGAPMLAICIAIFVVAWVGQFIGHKIEGKKPSFFKDVQFLLIGPIWLLAFVYKRLGIHY